MSLAFGRHFQAIPGPSVMPEPVLNAMHRDTPNIYEGPIIEVTERIERGLKYVARTQADVVIYIANGHGGWEASLTNVFSPGDRILALYTGRFTRGWADMAKFLGIEVVEIDFGSRAPTDANQVEAALRADRSIKAVMMVQTDTATAVLNDVKAVRDAIDAAGSDALLLVDCIASLACDEFRMDEWGVDLAVAGSQKGLMTPPGLAMNFVGPKARAARKTARCATPYWDWEARLEPLVYYAKFCGTAPTHHLFGLDAALQMIEAEGIEAVWKRHGKLAGAVHAAVETWSEGGRWELNIKEPEYRSCAVTTIRTGEDARQLRQYCEKELGLTLGAGISLSSSAAGAQEAGVFRIGHMGYLNPHMMLGTLGSLETAMQALGMPHGKGAIEAAARALAQP